MFVQPFSKSVADG